MSVLCYNYEQSTDTEKGGFLGFENRAKRSKIGPSLLTHFWPKQKPQFILFTVRAQAPPLTARKFMLYCSGVIEERCGKCMEVKK